MKPAFLLGVSWDGEFPLMIRMLKSTDDVRTADDDELSLILLSLVAYLGHRNPLVSGVSFNEVSFRTESKISLLTSLDSQAC
jgi:hypothetical protein